MSRGEDGKKLFHKSFFVVFALVCMVLIISFLIPKKAEKMPQDFTGKAFPFSRFEIIHEGEGKLQFRATVSRETISEFAVDRGIKLSFITPFLPETSELFCVCGIRPGNEPGNVRINIREVEINGISIPVKLLADTSEINLDFKHSLVYN